MPDTRAEGIRVDNAVRDANAVRGDENAVGNENAMLGDKNEAAERAGDTGNAVNGTLDEEIGDAEAIFGPKTKPKLGLTAGTCWRPGTKRGA